MGEEATVVASGKESNSAQPAATTNGNTPALDFVGRTWALGEIDAWLAHGAERFFHILGEPGSGKSALSRRLLAVSSGSIDYGTRFPAMTKGFIAASHFCSARDRRLVNPLTFAERIATQIAERSDVFREAMLKAVGAQITVEQHVEHAHDRVIGVFVQELNARGASPEDAFNRIVREPLEALVRADPAARVVILVDALDESLIYTGELGIVPLLAQSDTLPPVVRFIVTSRIDPAVGRYFAPIADDVAQLTLSDNKWDRANADDIAAYVQWRFTSDPVIAPQATQLGARASDVASVITSRSNGNFQYARFLLDTVAARQWELAELGDPDPLASQRPTSGMDALFALYMESLTRATTVGKRDWLTQYAPILQTLSAAQETLPRSQLRAITGQSDAAFRTNLDGVRQFVEEVEIPNSKERGHRLYHQSFADFLRTPSLALKAESIDNPFYLAPNESHARIGDSLVASYGADWSSCDDRYALRYVVTHAALGTETDAQPERQQRCEALVDLVTNEAFQNGHRALLRDPVALRNDFERTVRATAANTHPLAPPLVIRAALAYHALRRADTHPEELFALARAGDVDGAERRLAMFHPDEGWRQCVSLTIAWLAAPTNVAAAKSLRDRVVHDGLNEALVLLLARVDAALQLSAPPSLPALPPALAGWQVAQLVDRLAGNAVTGIEPLDLERIQSQLERTAPGEQHSGGKQNDAPPAYLAEADGPLLVSFVLHDGSADADALFERYIAVHASNGYEFYRNRSLWALIPPVLCHPNDSWVIEKLVRLGAGALAASPVRFVEALPLTVAALRARTEGDAVNAEYEAAREEARQHATAIIAARTGDQWAYSRRRLTALTEIESLVFGRHDVAQALISEASTLPHGFAGFNAMACLTLGDTLRIVQPANVGALAAATDTARQSAHNVQDFVFCARATSRVEAAAHWWMSTQSESEISDLIDALTRDPNDPRFAARYVIGENFAMRVGDAHRLPIPSWVRAARTLATLAELFMRPVGDFVRFAFADAHRANDELPLGYGVRVPDPSFPEMLAARFSADCLAAQIPAGKATRLIQRLVPVALRDPTALDLVLARLLLAWRATTPAALAHVNESVTRYLPPEVRREAPGPKIALPA